MAWVVACVFGWLWAVPPASAQLDVSVVRTVDLGGYVSAFAADRESRRVALWLRPVVPTKRGGFEMDMSRCELVMLDLERGEVMARREYVFPKNDTGSFKVGSEPQVALAGDVVYLTDPVDQQLRRVRAQDLADLEPLPPWPGHSVLIVLSDDRIATAGQQLTDAGVVPSPGWMTVPTRDDPMVETYPGGYQRIGRFVRDDLGRGEITMLTPVQSTDLPKMGDLASHLPFARAWGREFGEVSGHSSQNELKSRPYFVRFKSQPKPSQPSGKRLKPFGQIEFLSIFSGLPLASVTIADPEVKVGGQGVLGEFDGKLWIHSAHLAMCVEMDKAVPGPIKTPLHFEPRATPWRLTNRDKVNVPLTAVPADPQNTFSLVHLMEGVQVDAATGVLSLDGPMLLNVIIRQVQETGQFLHNRKVSADRDWALTYFGQFREVLRRELDLEAEGCPVQVTVAVEVRDKRNQVAVLQATFILDIESERLIRAFSDYEKLKKKRPVRM